MPSMNGGGSFENLRGSAVQVAGVSHGVKPTFLLPWAMELRGGESHLANRSAGRLELGGVPVKNPSISPV